LPPHSFCSLSSLPRPVFPPARPTLSYGSWVIAYFRLSRSGPCQHILCLRGGIGPQLRTLDDIRSIAGRPHCGDHAGGPAPRGYTLRSVEPRHRRCVWRAPHSRARVRRAIPPSPRTARRSCTSASGEHVPHPRKLVPGADAAEPRKRPRRTLRDAPQPAGRGRSSRAPRSRSRDSGG
jgi:hypothetical protein